MLLVGLAKNFTPQFINIIKGKSGLVFQDIEQLSDMLCSWIDNPEKIAEFGAAGQASIDKFRPANIARELAKYCRSLCHGREYNPTKAILKRIDIGHADVEG